MKPADCGESCSGENARPGNFIADWRRTRDALQRAQSAGGERAMSAASGEKKRRYPRVELPKGMWVAWHDGGRRWASRVQTLGMGGLFINIPDPPVVGTVVKLLFEVPSGEVRAQAVVRNVKPGQGMGVEFRQMAMEDRARLHQLLKRLIT
jgi:hypothetical protein